MIVLKNAVLFFLGFLNLIIGLAVLLRDPKRLNNILFSLLVFGIGGWVIAIGTFLLVDSKGGALAVAKIYYLLPMIITAASVMFTKTFPDRTHLEKRWFIVTLCGLLLLAIPLLLSPTFITQDLIYHDWGKEIILNRTHYIFYAVYLLICIGIAMRGMYLHGHNRTGLYAAHARLFFWGYLFSVMFAIYFNLLLPWAGNYRQIHLGPIFTSIFVITIAYGIVRNRMFDVRMVVARSVAYILSIMVLIVGYSLISYTLVVYVLTPFKISTNQNAMNIVLLVFVALTYTPVKKFFDQITNRVFYQDAYDTQTFLNQLNDVLVSEIQLDDLLLKSSDIIKNNLKADFCTFSITHNINIAPSNIGTRKNAFTKDEVKNISNTLQSIHKGMSHRVVITDELSSEYDGLKKLLEQKNIAVIVNLGSLGYSTGMGFLTLGYKKSGNPYSDQDVKNLDIIADELVIAIENALRFEEIQSFNFTLQQKVNEATKKLRATNEKLKSLDESKDEFISMASHQLRTPLTSVKGYVSMVLEGDAGKITAMQRQLLDQAFISSQRMVYLIADLLNVSRLRTGKFLIEPKPTNLAEVVGGEVAQLVETAKSRNLELTYNKPDNFPTLMLDETKVRQVVMNFIDNAIYYTPAGGHINVEVVDKLDNIKFTVKDDGIGVPKNEQHHLFSKFYRAGNARKARPDGTGLGLFMAQKVIIAQGGAIIFKSQEGKGSTFGFTFAKNKLEVK